MVGLFADHGADFHMIPAARFGNISMLPSDKALLPELNICYRDAFVLDMRSLDYPDISAGLIAVIER
jgi:hypothetical protein